MTHDTQVTHTHILNEDVRMIRFSQIAFDEVSRVIREAQVI